MCLYILMSHSLNNYSKKFYKDQYKETIFVKPNYIMIEKRYNDEPARNIERESIILMLIKTIFERAIEEMELTGALPSLIFNPELLLTTDEMDKINDVLCNIEFCSKYLSQSAPISKDSKTNVCSKETCYDTSRFDHAVYKALKILDKHMNDVLHTSPRCKHISMTSALFLYHIRYFLEHVLCGMYLTPEQVRSKELHYRKLWHCQKKSIEDVARSITDLERQRINHKKTLEDIVKQYKKNTAVIDGIDKRCNEYVTNTNMRYEKKQIAVYKAWEYEQNEMQLALENVIDDLESLKDINTKLGQTMHKRKLMTESKLLAIMTKYDTEIGSRCRTLEKLNQVYKYDKLEKHHLEKEMKRQEEVYFVFIKRKEKTEITCFYEPSTMFEQERSARIIQRWWRKIFLG